MKDIEELSEYWEVIEKLRAKGPGHVYDCAFYAYGALVKEVEEKGITDSEIQGGLAGFGVTLALLHAHLKGEDEETNEEEACPLT
jgi:hypothetical protein